MLKGTNLLSNTRRPIPRALVPLLATHAAVIASYTFAREAAFH